MIIEIGIVFAFIAFIFWGFGDYLIQKSTRKIGDWESLFYISLIGAIVILPFVWSDIANIFINPDLRLLYLVVASVILLIAALFELESLKKGKLAVVEPIYALEIPISGFLAFIFLSEKLTWTQAGLIATLVIGLVLVSLKVHHLNAKIWFEKGAILAVLSAFFMGTTNFVFGLSSRESSALMTNFFTDVFLVFACLAFIIYKRKGMTLFRDGKKHISLLFFTGIFDKIAWIAFAYAMVFAPISIAVAISQSYVIITVLLGMFINNEKLNSHQLYGLVISLISGIWLATIL